MKNLFLIILIGSLFLPLASLAGEYIADGKTIKYEGLVPCGGNLPPCQFCHLFVMLDGIIDFILFKIAPPLAVLMLVIGGVMFFFSGGSPATLTKAKSLITSVVIGLAIIYGAWMIIDLFLTLPGFIDAGKFGWDPSKWFQINCSI